MRITKKHIEKEPWLRSFVENINIGKTVKAEEETEIKEIRKRMASPVIRCKALKDNGDAWKAGDVVGMRECDFPQYEGMLEIIK